MPGKNGELRESGLPGGGAGRKDEVGGSGVYPMSGPHPASDAPLVDQAGWGQGARGAAGYEDHGESELQVPAAAPERSRDIMTKDPAFCLPGDSAARAAQLMMEHDVGILPVVRSGDDKDLLGVLTDRDLTVRIVAQSLDSLRTNVASVMSHPAIVCSPDDAYQKVLRTMERLQIRRVPVVDHSGRLLGMLSQADIALRVKNTQETAEMIREISRPAA